MDSKIRRLRVVHLVGADNNAAPNSLLLPLLTRGPRQRIENLVVHFAKGDTQFSVVRQSGIPVHELPLSLKSFSLLAPLELRNLIAELQPDVVHAWGATAQFAASMVTSADKKDAPQVWSVARTTPLAADAGWLDKRMLQMAKPAMATRIIYSSAVAAGQYRRAGWPEETATVIAGGIDADRYKPDPIARERVRKQLELPKEAIVIGMHAPYSPEFDHATLLKAVGDLIRTNQHLYCVLAGRAMQKGNAPLMAAVGGGTLGTRTRLIGEWSDLAGLFNACDVVCSSATTDSARLMLAIAMSCGITCVGTGVGAQGEVLGNFGISVEANSPTAMQRGLSRALDMPFERRAFTLHEARKHIWNNFNMARSIEKLHELYLELVPESLREPLSKVAREQPAPTLPPELVTFVPPPKPVPAPVVQSEPPPVAPPAARPAPGFPTTAKSETPESSAVEAAPDSPPQPVSADSNWSLDDALATQKVKISKDPTPDASNDSLEWSAAESELISSMMTEADPNTVKPVVVERPRPKPVEAATTADALAAAEAKARAARLMEARRAELRSTTATANDKPPAPVNKVAKG